MTYSMCASREPAAIKAWAENLWNKPGLVSDGGHNAFVPYGDGIDVVTRNPTPYLSKEAKAWRKQFQTYNKALKPVVLAEANLIDGVYTWPKAEKQESVAKPARKAAKRITKRKIAAVAAILAKLAKEQRAAFLAKWINPDLASSIAANDNLQTAAEAVLRAAYAA